MFFRFRRNEIRAEPLWTGAAPANLTQRQVTIVRFLAEGLSVKETAVRLQLSPQTVDNHKTRLMTKLGIHDRFALCRFALQAGLVDAA